MREVIMKPLQDGEYQVVINGIKHWCRIVGADYKTTPIIILHGGPGGNNYVFERTIGLELHKHFTIIYYEQRGSGRSAAPMKEEDYKLQHLIDDLREIYNYFDLNKACLLGYSFGAELALEFGLAHPELVDKLILSAPSNLMDLEKTLLIQATGFKKYVDMKTIEEIDNILEAKKSIEGKILSMWNLMDEDAIDKLMFYDVKHGSMVRNMWKESGLVNTGLMMGVLMKEDRTPVLQRTSECKIDTLILIGRHDWNVGYDLALDFNKKINNSKLIVYEKSAHFPDIEEPRKFVDNVLDFAMRN
jgi:proline iminopeptidase